MNERGGKKGQITIFIIVAIIIIAGISLFFLFRTQIEESVGITKIENPEAFLESCLKDRVKEAVKLVSSQGGYINTNDTKNIPFEFDNEEKINIAYLCYTSQDNAGCTTYEPLLFEHLKEEIKSYIDGNVAEGVGYCFDEMTKSLERQGYNIDVIKGDFDVRLVAGKIIITINNKLRLTKTDESSEYENFKIDIPTRLYELADVVYEIVAKEAEQGKFETGGYLIFYENLKNVKIKSSETSDYSNVYSVESKKSREKFNFAVRSWVIPPGY